MGLVAKARRILRREGVIATILAGLGYVYNRTIWPLLPERDEWVRYNGVKFHRRRLGDRFVRFPTRGSNPSVEYEVALGRAIREHVRDGDAVLEVAGGYGVTATIAARQVGSKGSVVTYEGSPELASKAETVVKQNDVPDRVTVRNSIVGASARTVRSDLGGASAGRNVALSDVPAADVFLIDCDGCEVDLLEAIGDVDPTRIIVEHHAVHDVDPPIEYDPDRIRAMLEAENYRIVETYTRAMDPPITEFGEEETVFVATR